MAEIACLLSPSGKRPCGGMGEPMDDGEMLAEAHRWQKMTPRERLEEGKRNRGL